MTTQNLKIVSKLTVKTLGAQPKPNTVKEAHSLAVVYGRCTGKKVGTSDFGDYVRFIGEFEGVNTSTGEVVRAGELIVPKILENLLSGMISLDAESDSVVEFAVDIWVEPTDKGATGYQYTIKPLVKPAESDALAALRGLVHESQPQLAAPAK